MWVSVRFSLAFPQYCVFGCYHPSEVSFSVIAPPSVTKYNFSPFSRYSPNDTSWFGSSLALLSSICSHFGSVRVKSLNVGIIGSSSSILGSTCGGIVNVNSSGFASLSHTTSVIGIASGGVLSSFLCFP